MIQVAKILTVEPGNLYRIDADTADECRAFVDGFCDDKAKKEKSKIEKHSELSTVFVDGQMHTASSRKGCADEKSMMVFSFDEVTQQKK